MAVYQRAAAGGSGWIPHVPAALQGVETPAPSEIAIYQCCVNKLGKRARAGRIIGICSLGVKQDAEGGRIDGKIGARIPQRLKPDDDLIGVGGTTEVKIMHIGPAAPEWWNYLAVRGHRESAC